MFWYRSRLMEMTINLIIVLKKKRQLIVINMMIKDRIHFNDDHYELYVEKN